MEIGILLSQVPLNNILKSFMQYFTPNSQPKLLHGHIQLPRRLEKSHLIQMVAKYWDPVTKKEGQMMTGQKPTVLATFVDLCFIHDPLAKGPSEISDAYLAVLPTLALPCWRVSSVFLSSCYELHNYQVTNYHQHGPQDPANQLVLWPWEVIYSPYAVLHQLYKGIRNANPINLL